jgi:hypothetical protein
MTQPLIAYYLGLTFLFFKADKVLADKAEENDIKRLEKALVDRE